MGRTRYVALLRGINVGGRNKVADGRSALGASRTPATPMSRTYIQSGNVLFTFELGPEPRSKRTWSACSNVASDTRWSSSSAPMRSCDRSMQRAPASFGATPGKHHSDAIFLRSPLTASQVMKMVQLRDGVDHAWPGRGVVYFERLSAERTKSRMGRIVGTPEYAIMTIRSWTTTTKLLDLFDRE